MEHLVDPDCKVYRHACDGREEGVVPAWALREGDSVSLPTVHIPTPPHTRKERRHPEGYLPRVRGEVAFIAEHYPWEGPWGIVMRDRPFKGSTGGTVEYEARPEPESGCVNVLIYREHVTVLTHPRDTGMDEHVQGLARMVGMRPVTWEHMGLQFLTPDDGVGEQYQGYLESTGVDVEVFPMSDPAPYRHGEEIPERELPLPPTEEEDELVLLEEHTRPVYVCLMDKVRHLRADKRVACLGELLFKCGVGPTRALRIKIYLFHVGWHPEQVQVIEEWWS